MSLPPPLTTALPEMNLSNESFPLSLSSQVMFPKLLFFLQNKQTNGMKDNGHLQILLW